MQPSASDENTRGALPRVSGIPQNLRLPNKTGQQLMEDAAYIDELGAKLDAEAAAKREAECSSERMYGSCVC